MPQSERERQPLEQMSRTLKEAAEQERKRRRKRRLLATALAWTLAAAAVLAVAAVAGAGIFILSGRSKLQNRTKGAAPTLSQEQTQEVQETGTESARQNYVWKEGWVRHGEKVYEYNDSILTFLIMGIDKMTPVAPAKNATDGGQADALFLAVVNREEKNVKILAINRDTMTDIYMYGFEQNGVTPVMTGQITLQHGFGDGMEQSCEATVKAVSELLYDLPIAGYAAINMGAIGKLSEAVEGVSLNVLEDLTKIHSDWTKGTPVHLKGRDAYDYVHWRDITVFESARGRLERQKQFLSLYLDRLKEQTKQDLTLPVRLYGLLEKYMVTDMTSDQAAYLATQLMNYDFQADQIYTLEGATIRGEDFEEFYPDKEALKELMLRLFYREAPMEGTGT